MKGTSRTNAMKAWLAALWVLSVCFFLIISIGPSALAQNDAVPQPVRIDFVDHRTIPEPFTGTWSATGAFGDSGTSQQSFFLSGSWPPATGHIDHILTSSVGTIHIRSQVSFVWSMESFHDHTTEGQFTIISGTGAYMGLHGRGTISMAVDFTPVVTPSGPSFHVVITGSYVGEANFAP